MKTIKHFIARVRHWLDIEDPYSDYEKDGGAPRFKEIVVKDFHRHGCSTKECPWDHPKRFPYQVYGDSTHHYKQVWTNSKVLPGHRLVVDMHSDRLYHVPNTRSDIAPLV